MRIILFLFLFLCVQSLAVASSQFESREAELLAEQLKKQISVTLAEIRAIEQSQGNSEKGFSIVLQNDGEQKQSLGAVIDKQSKKVLSVTSNSNASKLGVQVDDILLKLFINQQPFDIENSKSLSVNHGDKLRVSVLRSGKELTLAGKVNNYSSFSWKLEAVAAAAENVNESIVDGCGQVSVFFQPPISSPFSKAYISKVNGKSIRSGRDVIKLAVGLHTVELHELISYDIPLAKRKKFRKKAKTLEVQVEANKNYHLAAKVIKNGQSAAKSSEYWEPVVWQISDYKCPN